jgi:hypothetical protein
MKQIVVHDFGAARVLVIDVDPTKENDILVQQRNGFGGWTTVGSYNSSSDDRPYTSARDDAQRLGRRLESF